MSLDPLAQEWEEPDINSLEVDCDDNECHAMKSPITLEEYQVALEHWINHKYLSGCSHGQ